MTRRADEQEATCTICGRMLTAPAGRGRPVCGDVCRRELARLDKQRYNREHRARYTEEQKRRAMDLSLSWRDRRNQETRELATNHRRPWTQDEHQFLLDHPERSDTELALELGRTLRAIHRRKVALRKDRRPAP